MKLNLRAKKRASKKGLSLLEVLVVLSIIALVAGVVGPRAVSYLSRAKSKTAHLQINELESALELYFLDNGHYPAETAGLNALIVKPATEERWNGPYLKNQAAILDPWNRTYRYRYPGQVGEFDVYTLGRDGIEGGEGEDADLSNS